MERGGANGGVFSRELRAHFRFPPFFSVRACETTKLGRFRSDLGIFHIDELLIYLIINSESLFVRVRFSGYLSRLVL